MKKDISSNQWAVAKKSKIHNKGLFAKKDIPKGTQIIKYIGEKITKRESTKRTEDGNVYVFEYDKKYDIDGSVSWNLARFANHSCEPNCESIEYDDGMWIESLRKIKKGEEILYNYNYGWDEYEDSPCGCGSQKCIGFMLDEKYWKRLEKKQKQKKPSRTSRSKKK